MRALVRGGAVSFGVASLIASAKPFHLADRWARSPVTIISGHAVLNCVPYVEV